MKTVGVVGCGLMGSGIAQVSAMAGFTTWVREVDKATLDKGLGRIRKFLEDGVAKGKLTADVKDETPIEEIGSLIKPAAGTVAKGEPAPTAGTQITDGDGRSGGVFLRC